MRNMGKLLGKEVRLILCTYGRITRVVEGSITDMSGNFIRITNENGDLWLPLPRRRGDTLAVREGGEWRTIISIPSKRLGVE